MFGIMRPQKNYAIIYGDGNNYLFHRMHYCGVCKSLGKGYGQRSRFLLNFDIVFLSEILSLISNENPSKWSGSMQAINQCFKMPAKNASLPIALDYAATANVLLGAIKLDDNKNDNPGLKSIIFNCFFRKSFRIKNDQFKEWGIDENIFWNWVKEQENREINNHDFSDLRSALNYFAEPSAQVTGLILANAAVILNKNKLHFSLQKLGYEFGRLIYILDAFDDVEKDLFKRRFNPLGNYFNVDKTLQEHQFVQVRQIILEATEQVVIQLNILPIAADKINYYAKLLRSNIALRIYKERIIPAAWNERIRVTTQAVFRTLIQQKNQLVKLGSQAYYYLASIVVFVMPLAARYLASEKELSIYKWVGISTAFLALVGLGKLALKGKVWLKRKFRKIKFAIKIFFKFQWLKNFFIKKNPCDDACGEECLESCIAGLCEGLCFYICEATRENKRIEWRFVFIILAMIGILLMILVV